MARAGRPVPSTAVVAMALSGTNPLNSTARSAPMRSSAVNHSTYATAVATAPSHTTAASSPGVGSTYAPVATTPARQSGTATAQAYAETRSAPSGATSGAATSAKTTSAASATTASAKPAPPAGAPSPCAAATPAATSSPATTTRPLGRARASSGVSTPTTSGAVPTTTPTNAGSVWCPAAVAATLKPTMPKPARTRTRSHCAGVSRGAGPGGPNRRTRRWRRTAASPNRRAWPAKTGWSRRVPSTATELPASVMESAAKALPRIMRRS